MQGAVRAALPATLRPQLATLSKTVPTAGDWIHEIKFDGYRILARIEKGRVALFTRSGNDWTERMPALARAVAGLGIGSAWLDGEIVVLDESGVPHFNALQNAFDAARTDAIRYFVFDVPYCDGFDLRGVPLRERRKVLEALFARKESDAVRLSLALTGDAKTALRAACEAKLEGIIAKRADSKYASTRTPAWLKLKCSAEQEFVIGGYTDRTNSTKEIGSLLLGVYQGDDLVFAGGVGTGWSSETARALKTRLKKLEVAASPFAAAQPAKRSRWSRRAAGGEHWVKPVLVAQVAFTEWTPDGRIRHPSFQGLRDDKRAKEVVREVPRGA